MLNSVNRFADCPQFWLLLLLWMVCCISNWHHFIVYLISNTWICVIYFEYFVNRDIQDFVNPTNTAVYISVFAGAGVVLQSTWSPCDCCEDGTYTLILPYELMSIWCCLMLFDHDWSCCSVYWCSYFHGACFGFKLLYGHHQNRRLPDLYGTGRFVSTISSTVKTGYKSPICPTKKTTLKRSRHLSIIIYKERLIPSLGSCDLYAVGDI